MNHLKRIFGTSARVLDSISAYALWASHYPAKAHNPLMQIEETAMRSMLPDLRGATVLDLACGTGRYGLIAQAHDAKQVIGMDNSPQMMRVNELSLTAIAEVNQIALASQSVDCVICGLALGHLPTIVTAIDEIARVLKQGGNALISDFHPYQYLQGARRTFQAEDGTVYEVEHYVHHLSEYFAVAQGAGLQMTHVLEPIYAGDVPVILAMRFVRL